jgi:hypothetical protein
VGCVRSREETVTQHAARCLVVSRGEEIDIKNGEEERRERDSI